ncbi:unnamed protein product [Clonostachys rhizophaga]|uniref:Uncharacterized protein n=1 Tax=Clonostachys rhizophaga TaxID=160324 RepID=A0A9N9YMH0_9HYPO|nr:unnamed protein product [Clonostachys rhizophaga]
MIASSREARQSWKYGAALPKNKAGLGGSLFHLGLAPIKDSIESMRFRSGNGQAEDLKLNLGGEVGEWESGDGARSAYRW